MSWEGDILKKLRKERELTQAQFAEWLEIPKRTYEKWESGESVPPTWVVKLIRFKCEKSTQGEQIAFDTLITVKIKTQNNEWVQLVGDIKEAEDKKAFWMQNGGEVEIQLYKKI